MYVKHGHPRAKLDPDKVRSIRMLALYKSPYELAQRFGVSRHLIRSVILGHAWKKVTPYPERESGQ